MNRNGDADPGELRWTSRLGLFRVRYGLNIGAGDPAKELSDGTKDCSHDYAKSGRTWIVNVDPCSGVVDCASAVFALASTKDLCRSGYARTEDKLTKRRCRAVADAVEVVKHLLARGFACEQNYRTVIGRYDRVRPVLRDGVAAIDGDVGLGAVRVDHIEVVHVFVFVGA